MEHPYTIFPQKINIRYPREKNDKFYLISISSIMETKNINNTKPKNIFLVGAGHRGKSLVKLLIERNRSFQIKAIYDHSEEAIKVVRKEFPNLEAEHITSDIGIIDDLSDEIDLWMVCSMNNLHLEHCKKIIQSSKGKKHIFCEKPLCVNRDQLMALKSLVENNQVNFMTGFVLRHSSFFSKICELTRNKIGEIISMEVHDNLYHGHGALIMRNWRRHQELSGGHLVEKCVHILDLINWFLGADVYPKNVVTFGSKNIWTKENKELGESLKEKYSDPNLFNKFSSPGETDPFNSDKSILHNSVSLIRYSNGSLTTLNVNTFCPNSSRRFHIIGTLGEIEARWTKGCAKIDHVIRGIGKKDTANVPEKRIVYDFSATDCHGNADSVIVDYLAASVINDIINNVDFWEAYKATLMGVVLEESYEKNGEKVAVFFY